MTFTVRLDPFGNCKPEGFCDWAWADIWKDLLLCCDRAGFCNQGGRLRPCRPTLPVVPTACGR